MTMINSYCQIIIQIYVNLLIYKEALLDNKD